ncbi:hypothetical protein MLD38_022211 [Melastoma candidum]|uniref:Uncharacterized protein n=1 Tax=Melastoma candidum TaxID=119954 RepID=A0ACB9QJR9_9MYRT|nr:hypothetical protein MLD38_022211 [Melastoma candidum]
MERRSWPWKRKSSDKAAAAEKAAAVKAPSTLDAAGGSADLEATPKDQDAYKKPNYVQISVESYKHLTGLEEQVKIYEEKVEKLEEYVKELDEQLSAANSEVNAKENVAKQHAKVAEDAVSGWEKAEAEAIALQSHLESVKLSRLAAEDRAAHLDGALKECMRQIRNLKEDHEKELQEVISSKTRQWEIVKQELEARMINLEQELLRSAAENTALSRSLQERSNMLIKLNDEKLKAEARIEILNGDIASYEKEITSLKYEARLISKELEIRNEEKNMSVKSAEAANKQHMEGVKKIAKLEAERQRLRGLVCKRLPGPAALAQMKLEVDSLGVNYGESRPKRAMGKPLSNPSHIPELPPNGLLTQRLVAMEEETKMLKEALATCNSELLASRNLCGKVTSKLQVLEAQIQGGDQDRSLPASFLQIPVDSSLRCNVSRPPSLTSMSEDGNDGGKNCSESWATASVSDISPLKTETNPKQRRARNSNSLELMDDFLEMEKLASSSMETNGGFSDSIVDKGQSEAVNDVGLFIANRDEGKEQPLLMILLERISNAFKSSSDSDVKNVQKEIKRAVQDAFNSLQGIIPPMGDDSSDSPTGSENHHTVRKSIQKMTVELDDAVSHIRDFILLLHKEALTNHDLSARTENLGLAIEGFLVIAQKVVDGDGTLIDFVQNLSCILTMTSQLKFKVYGYRGTESETSSPDCIDKVALAENKIALLEVSNGTYQNGCANVSDTASNPEVPDYAYLVSGYGFHGSSCKVSSEDYENMKSEKESMALDLARCYEDMETMKSQLQDTESLLAKVKSQLAAAQQSNALAETQLKCMVESYRLLEARAEKLGAEINLLQTKTEGLEKELQEEKRRHQDTLGRSKDLEEKFDRVMSGSNGVGVDHRNQQERQFERLAECQETIFLLGKQLQSLRHQAELSALQDTNHDPKNLSDADDDDKSRISYSNAQDNDQAETDSISPRNLHMMSYGSGTAFYNSPSILSDSEDNLRSSPAESRPSKHRPSLSGSSSSSSPTPEGQSRGLIRFFAKGKSG